MKNPPLILKRLEFFEKASITFKISSNSLVIFTEKNYMTYTRSYTNDLHYPRKKTYFTAQYNQLYNNNTLHVQ
jgi:hypothetical protein